MGIYLLPNCDTNRAIDTWRSWLDQSRQQQNMSKILVKVQATPIDSVNQQRIILSTHFSYPKPLRVLYIIFVLFCLGTFEGTLIVLPWMGNFVWSKASSAEASLLGSLFAFLLCLSGLGPLIGFSSGASRLRKSEYSLQESFKKKGIAIFPLAPPSSWALFPRDTLIITGGVIGLICIQLLTWLGLSPFLPLLLPYLVIGIVLTFVVLLREYAYQKIVMTYQLHSYWKLEVTRLAGRATYFFLFSLLFYVMIFLLKTISFLLPLQQKGANWISASVVTTIGNPGLQEWEKSTHFILNQFFQQIISVSGVILTIVLLVSFIFAWKSIRPLSLTIWKDLEINPLEIEKIPGTITQRNASFLINVVLIFDWLLIATIHIIGVLAVAIGTLWPYVTAGTLISTVGDWTMPFLWYQEALKLLLGDIPGNALSNIIVFLVCAPAWLWLSMWICSLGEAVWRLLILKFSSSVKDEKLTTLVPDLCKQLHITSPIIRITDDLLEGIQTLPILPFSRFCVISFPITVIKKLTSEELRAVLAHELAHTAKHAWKIWLARQLSRIAIFGSGYLTLQLNYWEMEIEADTIAVNITGDADTLRTAIDKVQDIQGDLNITAQIKAKKEPLSQKSGLAKVILALYDWYFSNNLWGAFHPDKERLSNLENLSSTKKDEDYV